MPILAAGNKPPFAVDAVVREEDRWLVLSAPLIIPERAPDHPIRLHTELAEAEARPLGAVVMRPGQLLAVVHDLDRELSTTIADIELALANIVECCEKNRLKRLGIPLLGTLHGKLPRAEVLASIARALAKTTAIEAVWLMTGDESDLESLRASWP